MSEGVLTILKLCLLALLYLFLARVVWIVGRELRGTTVSPAAPPVAPVAKREKRRAWRIVVVAAADAAGVGAEHWIDGEATIGRGGGCTISVPSDTFVSQVHARLVERDGTLWVEDLGSTNGTFLNGKQVSQPTKLRKGDRVQIGETLLQADR
ncbi:MAG: FHA domain-containing protein [Actinomycetota bacterium]